MEDMTNKAEVETLLDGFGMIDQVQRDMYRKAMPRQRSMLYSAPRLILPFYKLRHPFLKPTCLSDLNEFASIWACVENILIAAASEGIFGVTRIPMGEELQHIQKVLGHPDDYTMPCYIALGYPAPDAKRAQQKEIAITDRIHRNLW